MLLRTIRPYLFLVVITLVVSSCGIKVPTFQSMSELKVDKFTKREITVKGSIVMNNPNKNSLNLNNIRLQMSSNKNVLGTFEQDINAPVAAFSNFTIPFSISFDPVQLGQNLVSTALSAFSDQKLKLAFKGHVQVSSKKKEQGGIKIPIIYSKSIKFR
ncbi:MAG: hypothetical protein ACPGJS_00510 [Flammeovirgaceae bacterium]